mgnify:FL=1
MEVLLREPKGVRNQIASLSYLGLNMSSAASDKKKKTEVGSYFISNYPPYSQWSADELPAVREALELSLIHI